MSKWQFINLTVKWDQVTAKYNQQQVSVIE